MGEYSHCLKLSYLQVCDRCLIKYITINLTIYIYIYREIYFHGSGRQLAAAMSSRRLSVEQPPDICRAAAGYLENLRIKLTQTFSRVSDRSGQVWAWQKLHENCMSENLWFTKNGITRNVLWVQTWIRSQNFPWFNT